MSWDLRCGASAYALSLQGYFSPVVVKYASSHQEKIANLILVNPPVCSVYISTIHFFFLMSHWLMDWVCKTWYVDENMICKICKMNKCFWFQNKVLQELKFSSITCNYDWCFIYNLVPWTSFSGLSDYSKTCQSPFHIIYIQQLSTGGDLFSGKGTALTTSPVSFWL